MIGKKNMSLHKLLLSLQPSNMFPFDLKTAKFEVFDFSKKNKYLFKNSNYKLDDLYIYIDKMMNQNDITFAIGKYNEDRIIYRHSGLFDADEDQRRIHLGIDVFASEGTKCFAPLKGSIHSYNNNSNLGDYGPTIILEHNYENIIFHTLYGHLSIDSLDKIHRNQEIKQGQFLSTIGNPNENGNWPPHLHFQIIDNIGDHEGDYPGVCSINERNYCLSNCPDPNLLLKIPIDKPRGS